MTKPWRHQPWADAYRLVILEKESIKRPGRVEAALSSISARVGELEKQRISIQSIRELDAIHRAHKILRQMAKPDPLKKAV